MMGHLNSFSASGEENLNKNFPKIQMPGGLPGGFDWYIILQHNFRKSNVSYLVSKNTDKV